jgi:hypothetical protein
MSAKPALIFLLSTLVITCTLHAMENQRPVRESELIAGDASSKISLPSASRPNHYQRPDLMPIAAKALIKDLNNPELYGQIDCILIYGSSGNGKSTIIKNIFAQINVLCAESIDAHDCIRLYAGKKYALIQKALSQDVIIPLTTQAQTAGSAYTALVIKNFQALDCNWNHRDIQPIMKALLPTLYSDLKPPLLIVGIASSLSKKIGGPYLNIIHVDYPNTAARQSLITYFLARHGRKCETDEDTAGFVQHTKHYSISAIQSYIKKFVQADDKRKSISKVIPKAQEELNHDNQTNPSLPTLLSQGGESPINNTLRPSLPTTLPHEMESSAKICPCAII